MLRTFRTQFIAAGILVAISIVAAVTIPSAYSVETKEQPKPGSAAETGEKAGQFIDDATITAKVKVALLSDSIVSPFIVKVDTNHGVVTLSGAVDKTETIERAVKLASAVPGVRGVEVQMHTRVAPTNP